MEKTPSHFSTYKPGRSITSINLLKQFLILAKRQCIFFNFTQTLPNGQIMLKAPVPIKLQELSND